MNFDNGQPSTSAGGVPAPIRKRRFSSAKIQPTRIKKVMQSDEDIGRMVASVPVAIGSAMEHFLERLLSSAAHCIQFSASRTLSPSHIKQAVQMNPYFSFLEPSLTEVPALAKAENIPAAVSVPQPPPEVQTNQAVQQNMYTAALQNLINATTRGGALAAPINGAASATTALFSLDPATITQQVLAQIAAVSSAEKRAAPTPVSAIDPTKPKRGRPRKIKKEEKCVDEEEPVAPTASVEPKPRSQLTDRELMPPPKLPIVRRAQNGNSSVKFGEVLVKKEVKAESVMNGSAEAKKISPSNEKPENDLPQLSSQKGADPSAPVEEASSS
ncbi:hypothetical protein L596_011246 [Steinernema carpocapsae]|uniref:Transcription factor CBF/NF-Y/archaeal histone domain-containing protein n=1 Tax=Steinernema carpocapsae TaxID=34508 RepID=A0A4U5NU62_STECR|nr:hypothetical protein L596_011246 [Steinernema carpocapsae]